MEEMHRAEYVERNTGPMPSVGVPPSQHPNVSPAWELSKPRHLRFFWRLHYII